MARSLVAHGRRPPLAWRSPNQRRIVVAAAGGGNDADAEAYFTAVGGLDATHTTAINTLIVGLKAESLWTKIGRLYLLANENATAACTDLKTAGDVLTVEGAPAFAADAGYTGDGEESWLVSAYNPTGSGLVTQNSGHLICVDATVEALPTASFGASCGLYDGVAEVGSAIYTKTPAAGVQWKINSDPSDTGASASSKGVWIASRTAADATALYFNGALDTAASTASGALPDAAFAVLASRTTGTHQTTHQIRIAGIGSGLTAGEAAAYTTLIEAYLDAIGAGVIT